MTVDEIIESLREDYALDSVVYTDSSLERQINKAVETVSEYYPAVELTSTTTIKDQTRYNVEHDDLIKLKKVYYRQGYSEADLFGDTDIQSATISTMPMSTFAPSLSVEMIARLELMRKIYPCDGEIVDHNSFDLIPTPDESGNLVYYEYERYRTIDEVPDMFEEDIIKLVFYYLGEKEAQKALLNPQGNKYNFDRRGNIGAPQSQNDLLQNSRNKQVDDIIKSIKTKVMKIG